MKHDCRGFDDEMADCPACQEEREKHSTPQETSKQMEDWEKEFDEKFPDGGDGFGDDFEGIKSFFSQTFSSQKQEIVDRLEEWIKVDVGAIPKTNDYANGWNECRHEVYDKIQEPFLSQLKKIREEI